MASNSRIDELTKRLEKEPGSRLFAQLAEELRKEGTLADAIRVSREGLTKHPNYPSARMTLGRALLDTGDLPGARAEFDAVLKAAPDNILASRFLAECFEGLGEPDKALAQYQAALRLAPGDKAMMARVEELERGPRGGTSAAAPPASAPAGQASTPGMPVSVLRPSATAPAAAAASAPPTTRMAEVDPPPIPLVAAEEEFEIERPNEAPTIRMPPPSAPSVSAAPPVARPSLDGNSSQTLPRYKAEAAPAPPPPPVPLEERTARFMALDDEPSAATIAVAPPTAVRPAAPPVAPALPPPPSPPAVSLGDASGQRRAGLDTLFRFSALEEAPEPEVLKPAPFVPSEPERSASGEPVELLSPTMAELYFSQGHLDKAIEVYRKLLRGGTDNERARLRLIELESLLRQSLPPEAAAVAAPISEASREARRAAIQKTIDRLERLLAAFQRSA